MKPPNLITLRVWGDFACFTRPEMKVERVSYAIMTPSAARGILEAVFWEPQMFYLIDSIRVVKKGRWFSFRRNEVIKVISLDSAKTWMREPDKVTPIQAGGGAADGTQRNMLALHDVEYLITAEVRTTPLADRPEDKLEKYLAEIERRARQGKCFHRPALGVREFSADFDWEPDPDAALQRRYAEETARGNPLGPFDEDLGLMLYDVFDHNERQAGFRWFRDEEITAATPSPSRRGRKANATEAQRWTGKLIRPQAAFFFTPQPETNNRSALIRQGVLRCHPEDRENVQIIYPTTGGN